MVADQRAVAEFTGAATSIVRQQAAAGGARFIDADLAAAIDAIADAIRGAAASPDADDQAIAAALMAGDATLAEHGYAAQIAASSDAGRGLNLKAAQAARGRAALTRLTDVRQAAAFYRLAADFNADAFGAWREAGQMWRAADDLPNARRALDGGFAAAERLRDERWRSAFATRLGDVGMSDGSLADAAMYYQLALAVDRQLAAAAPGDVARQRDLAVSHSKFGDVQAARGDPTAAVEAYQSAHARFEQLARAEPMVAGRQRDVAVSLVKLGGALVALNEMVTALPTLHTALRLLDREAKAQPTAGDWPRNMAAALQQIGTAEVAQGNLEEAVEAFKASIGLREWLAKTDPDNVAWKRTLAAAHDKASLVLDKAAP